MYRDRFGLYPPSDGLHGFSQTSVLGYLRDRVRNVRDLDGEFMAPLLNPPKDRVLQEKYMDPFRLGQCYEYASDGNFYVLRCAGPDGQWVSTDEELEQGIDRAKDNIIIEKTGAK